MKVGLLSVSQSANLRTTRDDQGQGSECWGKCTLEIDSRIFRCEQICLFIIYFVITVIHLTDSVTVDCDLETDEKKKKNHHFI